MNQEETMTEAEMIIETRVTIKIDRIKINMMIKEDRMIKEEMMIKISIMIEVEEDQERIDMKKRMIDKSMNKIMKPYSIFKLITFNNK